MHNEYAKAIDLLMSDEVDFRQLAIDLAKVNPELFCQLAAGDDLKICEWHREVWNLGTAGDDVGAIKVIRQHTGMGLKESKDLYDHFINSAVNAGHHHLRYHNSMPELDREQTKILNQLIKVIPKAD